jgi:hypothetical protein
VCARALRARARVAAAEAAAAAGAAEARACACQRRGDARREGNPRVTTALRRLRRARARAAGAATLRAAHGEVPCLTQAGSCRARGPCLRSTSQHSRTCEPAAWGQRHTCGRQAHSSAAQALPCFTIDAHSCSGPRSEPSCNNHSTCT